MPKLPYHTYYTLLIIILVKILTVSCRTDLIDAAVDRVIIKYANPFATRNSSRPGLRGLEVVPLDDDESVEEALMRYKEHHPEITHVEPDRVVTSLTVNTVIPNDSRWFLQWGASAVGADKAWNMGTTGSKNITICVIDSGIDVSHPDLAGNIHPKIGFDALTGTEGNITDENGHGTHVAGVVAAIGNNSLGIAGLNWKAQLLACKFLDASGRGYLSGILSCIDYCVRNGASISVNSYSMTGLNRANSILRNAIEQAGATDHLFIAAAGNAGQNNDLDVQPSFPAAFALPNMISVAAVEMKSGGGIQLANYSNRGKATTHVAAPGTNILSTWPPNVLAFLTGTSMAAPHVAGAAALLKSASHGKFSNAQIRSIILQTSRNLTELNDVVASGMLDLDAAMQRAMASVPLLPGSTAPAPMTSPMTSSPSTPDVAPAPAPQPSASVPKDKGQLHIVMDLSGSSCVAFQRWAVVQYSRLLSTTASNDSRVKITALQNICRGPYLSHSDPQLQYVHVMEISQGLPNAYAKVHQALTTGMISYQMSTLQPRLYKLRSFKITTT